MLVVNGIKLVVVYQLHQVGKLHGHHSIFFQDDLHTCHKINYIGYMCQYIISKQQIRFYTFCNQFFCQPGAKKINDSQNKAAGTGTLTQFYTSQRVIDYTLYPDQVRPYDPNAELNRGGDNFWVFIR